MSADFTTDNIDRLQARPLEDQAGWEITFRSSNTGMHHQLYVNGRLAERTDDAEQRRFVVQEADSPRELLVAAVREDLADTDLSGRLDEPHRLPAWVHRTAVVRSVSHRPGTRLLVLGDHATGQMDPSPLVELDLWPAWSARWAWGEDPFGRGGFGHDGSAAPGLGRGAFGAASFGMDAEVLLVDVPLNEEGTHQIVLRSLDSTGRSADAAPRQIVSSPPPRPANGLACTQYDPGTCTLTLHIQ